MKFSRSDFEMQRFESCRLNQPVHSKASHMQVAQNRAVRRALGLSVRLERWHATAKDVDEITSHFMLDEVGDLTEHLGGTEDYLLAAELYEVTLKRWPTARIQMRQGARIVYDSMRGATL